MIEEPDVLPSFDAKIFAQLEEQDTLRKAKLEQPVATVKVSPVFVNLYAREAACSLDVATQVLQERSNDLNKSVLDFITDFPQARVYRKKDNILGP